MSRIGKKPVVIPANTEVTVEDSLVTVKGPKGELSISYRPERVNLSVEDGIVVSSPVKDDVACRSLWGTYASHIGNMIQGVNELFEKKLIIEGVGFRATHTGNNLTMQLGFSHPVEVEVPADIELTVEKNDLTIRGISKESVGQFAATIREYKKPEPYKGKGIRYSDEIVRRKEGKKTV
jgi:large subunit ribosomal protein L6